NGRLYAGEVTANQFLGPAIGAWLFGLAAALPILLDAGTFAIAAGLLIAMSGTYSRTHRRTQDALRPDALAAAPGDGAPTDPTAMAPTARTGGRRHGSRAEIGEGLQWLRGHRLLRTFAVLTAAMNGATMT